MYQLNALTIYMILWSLAPTLNKNKGKGKAIPILSLAQLFIVNWWKMYYITEI